MKQKNVRINNIDKKIFYFHNRTTSIGIKGHTLYIVVISCKLHAARTVKLDTSMHYPYEKKTPFHAFEV